MANTRCYILTFWAINEQSEMDIAIKSAVHTPTPVDWTERANTTTPIAGDLAVAYGHYRNANEYPILTAAACPSLAPASCRHYLIAYRVEGGDDGNYVTDYNEAIGAQGLSALLDWLAVWYPSLRPTVAAALTASSTHYEAARAVAVAYNPTLPPWVD